MALRLDSSQLNMDSSNTLPSYSGHSFPYFFVLLFGWDGDTTYGDLKSHRLMVVRLLTRVSKWPITLPGVLYEQELNYCVEAIFQNSKKFWQPFIFTVSISLILHIIQGESRTLIFFFPAPLIFVRRIISRTLEAFWEGRNRDSETSP